MRRQVLTALVILLVVGQLRTLPLSARSSSTFTLSAPPTPLQVGARAKFSTALQTDAGTALSRVRVRYMVTGAHPTRTLRCDCGVSTSEDYINGRTKFSYVGTRVGQDTVFVYADMNDNGTLDSADVSATATITWVPGPPTDLSLNLVRAAAVLPDSQTVTATVQDQFGNGIPGINVQFQVTGQHTRSTTMVTDKSGRASFTYAGTLSGSDEVLAVIRTIGNELNSTQELSDRATVTWVLPPSTPNISVRAHQDLSDEIEVVLLAESNSTSTAKVYLGFTGFPPRPIDSRVASVVVRGNGTTIFGEADNGVGQPISFRIDLLGGGEEPEAGAMRVQLSTGQEFNADVAFSMTTRSNTAEAVSLSHGQQIGNPHHPY